MKPVADNSRQKSVILRTLSRNHSKKWYFIKVYHTGYIFQGYFQMPNLIICFWKFIWHHHPTTPKIHDINNEIFFTQDYIFGDIFKSHILSYALDNSLDIITKQLQKSKISEIRYFSAHGHTYVQGYFRMLNFITIFSGNFLYIITQPPQKVFKIQD